MVCLPEYKAGKADICQIIDVAGVLRYFVRLPDGYLVECGDNFDRAEAICDAVNVMMKWAYSFPPVGSVEQAVRDDFASEDRWLAADPYTDETEGKDST